MRSGRELYQLVCEAGNVAEAIKGLTHLDLTRLHDYTAGRGGIAEVIHLQCTVDAAWRFLDSQKGGAA